MLTVIFGDDEHTAADGPYARVMKTRKWLYVSSAAELLVDGGLYNEEAARALVEIIAVPASLLGPALAASITYLLIQYLLLSVQLIATYDIVLNERFTFRRADELSAARDFVNEAQDKLRAAMDRFSVDSSDAKLAKLKELEAHLSETRDEIEIVQSLIDAAEASSSKNKLKDIRHRRSRIAAKHALAKAALKKLSESSDTVEARYDPGVDAATGALDQARAVLLKLQNQDSSVRRGYSFAERAVDLGRIVPPVGFAVWALIAFARS